MKRHKYLRILQSVVSVFSLVVIFPYMAHSENGTVIRVAGDKNFPPFEFIGNTGDYIGFNIDVMKALASKKGIRIEFYPMSWNEAVEALKAGRVEAIQGMKYSPGRGEVFRFSDPYFTSSQGIFVLKDNLNIRELQDLEGKRVAVQKGDIANDLLGKLNRLEFIKTDSQQEAIQLLVDGKVDAFVGNRITGQYFIQNSNQQDLIKIVGEPIDPTAYGIAVLPRNKALLDALNDGISQIKNDGTYKKIEQHWFGEYIMPSALKLREALVYFECGFIITCCLVLAVVWWNRVLKREVAKRTAEIAAINKKLEDKMGLLEENVFFQQQLLDSTYSCFITLNESAAISMMNQRAIDYLGLQENLVGKKLANTLIADFIPVLEVEEALQHKRVYLQKEVLWQCDMTSERSHKRCITYSIHPIATTSGEIAGAVLNFTDITEQKEFEQKLAQEDRLRSLGRLMLGIAHEIRNPLTSILAYTELLPKKFDNPEFRTFFALQVSSEITRLNSLVNDLLDYARPRKSEPSVFSVLEVVTSILQLFRQKINEKDIHIDLELDEKLEVIADKQQIKQVLMNIILNAIQAVENNGKLKITGSCKGGVTVIEIADDGCGIAEEEFSKIFEPFYSNKANGTGLGLPISYQLVKENLGTIDVISTKESGTTMIVTLPGPERRP
ncbi:transporter substrate-binding domain-containing protein [Brevibacillus massiliensis]|uniref:transporter substrate-binding domain-containing protein n=1 Tax=Brevibacillus massiliensis TaxID=1118054 RepID=UPI00037B0D19|nr:transporter substrate-binding domain-containing protein [Brevibacillus massiliensis]